MGRRDEEDEPEEDLDEAEEFEDDDDDEDEPAPRKKAPRAKAAPKPPKKTRAQPSQKGVPKPSPAETRALDARIFAAADKLEAKLGRAPTLPEIADAAKVPGSSADARRMRVGKALRRRGLLTAAKAAKPKLEAEVPRLAPPVIIARLVLRGRRGSRFLLMSGDVTSRKCTGPELVGGVLS